MRKVEILSTKKQIEEISERADIRILSIDIKVVDQSFYFQESICAVVYYEDDLKIIDQEQRVEFAKSAMQGLLANRLRENIEGWNLYDYINESVQAADLLIAELKKQKP